MSVDVVVSDAIDELILGLPFLVLHNCCWHFGAGQMSIVGRVARLHDRPSRSHDRCDAFTLTVMWSFRPVA
jgi:hypothetical protein